MVMLQVRVTDADKDVPLYVVIRKWVQNDPDAELMPLPAHGDDLAEAKRSLAPKLPPVPPPSEEEVQLAQQHFQESIVGREDEPASVEVSCLMNRSACPPSSEHPQRFMSFLSLGCDRPQKGWNLGRGHSPQVNHLYTVDCAESLARGTSSAGAAVGVQQAGLP